MTTDPDFPITYTDGTVEQGAGGIAHGDQADPSDPSPISPEQAATLAAGPKSLMDVARRAGRVDTPRLQMSTSTRAAKLRAQETLAQRAASLIFGRDQAPTPDGSRADVSSPRASILPPSVYGGYETRSFGWSSQRSRERQVERQIQDLARVAAEPADHGEFLGRGGEHQVFHRAGDTHLTKLTHTGRYGQVLDQAGPGQGYKLSLRPATPAEYVHRIGLQNAVFGDDAAVVAVERGTEGPVIVTRQRRLLPGHPSQQDAEDFLRDNGFVPMPESMYNSKTLNATKRPWIRTRDNVVIADAKKENFAHDPDGNILPIDLVIQVLPDDLLDATRNRAQYSKPQPGVPLNTLVENTRAVAQEAARLLNRQLPGIVGPKLMFFANPAELLASDYAGKDSLTEAELAQMQDAEGFYDNDTGHTIIFTDAIEVRPGESQRAAVARVILHERVGHDGFNALLLDPAFAKTWETLAAKIPEAELDAIIHDGYAHLAGDRHQLALEWFARAVESRLHLKEGNLAQRLWRALKDWYQRTFKPFAESRQNEAELRTLIAKAQEAAQNGTAIPTTADGLRAAFAPLSPPQKEHRNAIHALLRAFQTGQDQPDAFIHPELGPVSIIMGSDGTAAKEFTDGYGINGIITKRLVRGEDPVSVIPGVIRAATMGTITRRYGGDMGRVDLLHGNHQVTLSLQHHGNQQTWILTDFELTDGEPGKSYNPAAYAPEGSVSRQQVVASITGKLSEELQKSTRLQLSLDASSTFEDTPVGGFLYDQKVDSELTDQERTALAGYRAKYGSRVQAVAPAGATRGRGTSQPARTTQGDHLAEGLNRQLAALFGKTILFVDGPAQSHGVHYSEASNILVVNANSDYPLLFITGHELTHALKLQAPDLYDFLETQVLMRMKRRADYSTSLAARGYAKADLNEESVADFVGSQFLEPDFFNRLAGEQPSLFARFATFIKRFLDNLLGRATKLERDIRPHLRDIETLRDILAQVLRQYSERGHFPDNPVPGVKKLNEALGGTRVFEEGGNRPFRVNNLGLRTLLTGSALPKAFHETAQATERQRRALDQVAAQIGLDLKTAIEAHATATQQPLANVYDMVHQAMNGAPGTNAVLLAINPTLAERARVARNFIDDMSVAIANTLPKGDLRNRIILNQGSWMQRQYACFDPASGWNFDNVMKAAREGKAVVPSRRGPSWPLRLPTSVGRTNTPPTSGMHTACRVWARRWRHSCPK